MNENLGKQQQGKEFAFQQMRADQQQMRLEEMVKLRKQMQKMRKTFKKSQELQMEQLMMQRLLAQDNAKAGFGGRTLGDLAMGLAPELVHLVKKFRECSKKW